MDPVHEFISRYIKEYDFYAEAGRIASNLLNADLSEAGVRSIVTHRPKDVIRLEEKCRQRRLSKNYQRVQDLYNDIPDLAGVRIALYFPGDREKVDQAVRRIFDLLANPKKFPEEGKQRGNKVFHGYSATHYRVQIRPESLPESGKRYSAARIEIQVASVLMHAWAEVEHDLAYKPLVASLSEEEKSILDELNGLVLTGEVALERLQKAGEARSSIGDREFANHYDLAAHLYDYAASKFDKPVSDSGIGRVNLLYELLKELGINTPEKLLTYLQSVARKRRRTAVS